MVTVTKKDLVALGYGNSFATDIIRLAKIRMVEKVPAEAVEELLGIALDGDAAGRAPEKGVKTNGKRPN